MPPSSFMAPVCCDKRSKRDHAAQQGNNDHLF
jgi:hypothetical protein